MYAWVRQEGWRAAAPNRPSWPTLTRLAAGDADRLSGCHLSVHDDLDAILACGEDVRDRYQLRRAGDLRYLSNRTRMLPRRAATTMTTSSRTG